MSEKIPLLDLTGQYQTIREEIRSVVDRVMDSQYFILGPEVTGLEEELAKYCQADYCVGMSSGTDAILVALMALEIQPGDEVITSPYTFFATGGCVARLGAKPVFIDIDPETFNIDPNLIEAKITPRTKAIMPVHLYGQAADMSAINDIAAKHGLAVIEDAAQAIGAEHEGQRVGSLGTMGCFSFFPSKNLGAFGDAGAVTTNDQKLYERLKALRMHGQTGEYHHQFIGGNFRIDALQAAILRIKLHHLDGWTTARQANAAAYTKLFRDSGLADRLVRTPMVGHHRHVFNQYIVRCVDREAVRKHLLDNNIAVRVYYGTSLHQQPCFAYLGHKVGDFPHSEAAANSNLALPVYPEMTLRQIRRVVDVMADYYHKAGHFGRSEAA